ncbi:MAG: cytochrome c oxidase assembly protein [Alphaproteobacteria bacterium]|nr:cytochrome c oxidase assembly protein [Alphaproteobacteria bacterium]
MARSPDANRRTALMLGGVAATMAGASFAAVPLYRLFCQVTGYGGTTQRADAAPAAAAARIITVRFDASVSGNGLPWTFMPVERRVQVRVGEERLAFYRATNNAREATTGTATFNVTPFKAGPYFNKIACFCFSEQTLAAGQSIEMPVSFFVDPAILDDPNLADVDTITLSYTFFRVRTNPGAARNAAALTVPSRATN